MELNMNVLVKVAVMLFLLGITASVEARFDARSIIKEVPPNAGANYYSVKSTATSQCICTRPWPVYNCICPGEECFAGCNGTCYCEIDLLAGTRKCKCVADETKLSPGAGAH